MVDLVTNKGIITKVSDINIDTSRSVFDNAYRMLMELLYPDEPEKRKGDLVLDAVYERMREKALTL